MQHKTDRSISYRCKYLNSYLGWEAKSMKFISFALRVVCISYLRCIKISEDSFILFSREGVRARAKPTDSDPKRLKNKPAFISSTKYMTNENSLCRKFKSHFLLNFL